MCEGSVPFPRLVGGLRRCGRRYMKMRAFRSRSLPDQGGELLSTFARRPPQTQNPASCHTHGFVGRALLLTLPLAPLLRPWVWTDCLATLSALIWESSCVHWPAVSPILAAFMKKYCRTL